MFTSFQMLAFENYKFHFYWTKKYVYLILRSHNAKKAKNLPAFILKFGIEVAFVIKISVYFLKLFMLLFQ